MWLPTKTGTSKTVQVKAIRAHTSPDQSVHNLTIAGTHTYYVLAGQTPILVHNCRVDEVAKNIANSVRMEMGHFVRGVDPKAFQYYVEGVINGQVLNSEIRYLRNGRIGSWGSGRKVVVIEDGDGGTVFTSKEGKAYFDDLR